MTTKPLNEVLKEIRSVRGYSLREVEKATKISNAYLSQLERGDAANPSPDKLHALAKFYDVPYMELMRAAGYVQHDAARTSNPTPNAVQAALMSAKLTPEEENKVVQFIGFLRFQNKNK